VAVFLLSTRALGLCLSLHAHRRRESQRAKEREAEANRWWCGGGWRQGKQEKCRTRESVREIENVREKEKEQGGVRRRRVCGCG